MPKKLSRLSVWQCRLWLLLLLGSSLRLFSTAQEPPRAPAASDNSQAGFVFEQSLERKTFENDGTSVEEDQGRVKIQSEAGLKRYGLLSFSYASGTSSLEIDYIRVRKPDGSVVTTPLDDVQDMPAPITREAPFYSDLHEKQIAVKGLSLGDILEFRVLRHITKPLAPGNFWTDYRFSKDEIVLDEQLQIRVPRDRPINFKSAVGQPTLAEEGSYRVYTWHHANPLPAKTSDDKRKAVERLWQQERGRLAKPDVLLSSFKSWEEVGRWYGGLQAERVKPSPEIIAKASELTRNDKTDDDKIRTLYAFVATQFRYIGISFGIGRYQPHAASEVLSNQYGDCKDKHTLLASLLTAVGIPAYPALISSYWEPDPDVASPGQFNHVITLVPRGNNLIWLDTTTEVGPYQYLVSSLRDKSALAIWSDKPAALTHTPADPPFAESQAFKMTAKLNESATLEGHIDFTARGDVEYLLREGFRSVSLSERKDLVQRISYSAGFGGEVSDVTASSVDKTDEPFRFSYSYTRKNYGDWDNRRVPQPMPVLAINFPNDEDSLPEGPTWLGTPADIKFESEIELPAGYHPQLPAPIHFKQDFAEYDSTTEFKDGKLIGVRQLRTFLREVPVAERGAVKELARTLQDDYGSMVTLYGGERATSSSGASSLSSRMSGLQNLPTSSNPEAARLEQAARDQIQQRNAASAVSSLYRAVAADPKFTRAWVMLGTLLISQGQLDAGTDAFHKAIETRPNEPDIPKALAYILMASSHFEQATSAWQDYVKANPDDLDGTMGLSQSLTQSKRYPEALSAVQAAASKHRDNADLQSSLGYLYVQTGEKAKAAEAYRTLASLHPSPASLNNVAYVMADADVDLPLALDFARQSAQNAEADSEKITLPALSLADLRKLQALAAIWDTVGWVYAKTSNYAAAETYLLASWKLSQDGVVGSHLCQMYDKQHKIAEAISACRMASSRLSLSQMAVSEGVDSMQETQTRLDRLTAGKPVPPGQDGTNLAIRERTYKLPRLLPGNESAEFYVLLASDGKASKFQVEDVKFISGSEKLKSQGKQLRTINFAFPSPPGSVTKIVRRGILGCYQYTGCSFVLLDPGWVQSLD